MNRPEFIPWKRIAVEAAAIVASILLAFSIDAWWDNRQQRTEEQLILGELLKEFQHKKSNLDIRTKSNIAILVATKSLLTLSRNPNSQLTMEEMDRQLYGIYWYTPGGEWDAPVLQSLVNSGDLALISNPSLRTSLAAWAPRFEHIKQKLASDRDFFARTLEPFLINNVDMPQFNSAGEGIPGRPGVSWEAMYVDSAQRTDHRSLLGNRVFENILLARAESINDILASGFRDVDAQLDTTIRLIEADIAE